MKNLIHNYSKILKNEQGVNAVTQHNQKYNTI